MHINSGGERVMSLSAELKQKSVIRLLMAGLLCLCLVGTCFGAIGESGMAVVKQEPMTLREDGVYASLVTVGNLCGQFGGDALYKLEAVIDLTGAAAEMLALNRIGVAQSDAAAITVQALNASGEPLDVQKTLNNGRALDLPEGTLGVKLCYYADGKDFTCLPAGFDTGLVEIAVSGRLNASQDIGFLRVSASAAVGDAAASRTELPAIEAAWMVQGVGAEANAAPASDAAGATAPPTESPTAAADQNNAVIMSGASPLAEGQQIALASVSLQTSVAAAADGSFRFDGLPAGDYSIYVPRAQNQILEQDSQWLLSQQGDTVWMTVSLKAGESFILPEIAFAAQVSVKGCAYADNNASLTREEGEQLMSGVAVLLQRMENGAWTGVESTVTDAYGQYLFQYPGEGEFRVCAQSDAANFYVAAVGNTAAFDGKAACGAALTLANGDLAEADVSLQTPASLQVTAFLNKGMDGVRIAGDAGIPGVLVEVMEGEAVLAAGTTDTTGQLTLAGVRPGQYSLRMTAPDGYSFTAKGPNPSNGDSCVGGENGTVALSDALTLESGRVVNAAAGLATSGTFSGKVFADMNNDGVMDENDPGVAGVVLRLEGQKTGRAYELTTDETGLYQFTGLPDDQYLFKAQLPEGMLYARYSKTGGDLRSVFSGSVVTREFVVKNAEDVTNKNVGVVENGTLSGTAFLDLNYNGYYDEGEPGYAGVVVEAIKLSTSDSMGKTTTGEDGAFRLDGLRGGDYRLRAILPNNGSCFTAIPADGGEKANYFEYRAGRRENSIQPISILSGATTQALVGVAVGATVRGVVFQDVDYNGRLDEGEKRLSGVAVQIVNEAGNVAAVATTDAKGQYTLLGMMPGTYTVMVKRVNGSGFTRLRPDEAGGSHVVELLDDYGRVAPMQIAMGQSIEDINAGMLPSATVTGKLFNDLNDDGLAGEGETGMLGANVRLLSEDGEIDLVRPVQPDGAYFFDGVMPGNYTLTFQLPPHTEIANVAAGGNTLENQGQNTVTSPFAVAMGASYEYPLVGAVVLGSFEGVVFNDGNGNGVQDDGEQGLAGAAVTLTPDRAEVEESAGKSGKDGSYAITGLRPASYKLTLTLPEGYILSRGVTNETLELKPESAQTLNCSWEALVNRAAKAIGAVKPASVAGVIWLDENKDGKRAGDEALMGGITVELLDEGTGATAARVNSTEDGFLIDNIRPGVYTVRFVMPAQAETAADSASTFKLDGRYMQQTGIVIAEGQKLEALTTGLVSRTSIGGKLWLEAGGQQSAVSGVEVSLWLEGEKAPIQTTISDASGAYQFDGLWPGSYVLKAALPEGMIFVRPGDPNFEAGASVISTATEQEGSSAAFSLQMARHLLKQNIIYIKPARIGDQVWLDENQNGMIDGDEAMIPGVKLTLVQNGEAVYETTSNQYGYYLFDTVYPGAYVLQAEAYPELTPTLSLEKLRLISSCLTGGDGVKGTSDEFSVESGSNNVHFKVGYILKDGQQLPEAIVIPEGRDWSVSNQKYIDILEMMK